MAVYTTIDDPSAYFQVATYTGNATNRTITNDGISDLQPDLIWFFNRASAGFDHYVYDSTRGVGKKLFPNTNAAEGGFVVKSSANSKTDHGLWNVKVDGTLSPMNAKAQERDSEITSGQCKNLIKSETEAISAVWAYIVKCNPLLDINDLDSNWDPKEDDWVVITKKSAQTRISNPEPDHGIWRVTRDAQITADNVTAQTEKIRADQGTEKC